MRALRHIPRLALRDFVHEAAISACIVGSLAAVLAPLLVLFGLKYGVVDTISRRLIEDPHSRELILVGSGKFTATWVETLRRRPDVSFAIPETRRLSASFNRLENPVTGAQASAVGMVPSGPGEPLVPPALVPESDLEVALSTRAAQRLGVASGDTVRAVVGRLNNGTEETVEWDARVRAVVPEAALSGDSAFVTLALLVAIEDFRDGMAVDRFGWTGHQPGTGERVFPRFRLYARSIYDVAALRDSLFSEGVELRSRAEDVEVMQVLDANLTRVFWTVAVLGSAGFAAALAASLVAGVERKRRDLSVLRLIGFPGRAIIAFPLFQALLIGATGSLLAIVAYAGVAAGLNAYFADSLRMNEFVCRLLPEHLTAATAITLTCALAAATWAGLRAARIQPAEGLRDV